MCAVLLYGMWYRQYIYKDNREEELSRVPYSQAKNAQILQQKKQLSLQNNRKILHSKKKAVKITRPCKMKIISIPTQTRPSYSYANVRIGYNLFNSKEYNTYTNKISIMNIDFINHYIELRPQILSMFSGC